MNPKTIITLSIIAFAGVVVFVLVLPQWRKIQDTRSRVSVQREEAQRIEQEFEATKEMVAKFQALAKKEKERVSAALPQSAALPDLYVLVDSLVTSSGLVSEDISISIEEPAKTKQISNLQQGSAVVPTLLKPASDEGLSRAMISVSILGEYEAFKGFLQSLERSLRIFDIQSIDFASPRRLKGGGFEPFRFSITVKTYFKE